MSKLPIFLKRKVFYEYVSTFRSYQGQRLLNAEMLILTKRIFRTYHANNDGLLGITLRGKIPNQIIRLVREYEAIVHLKWNWAGHVARMD